MPTQRSATGLQERHRNGTKKSTAQAAEQRRKSGSRRIKKAQGYLQVNSQSLAPKAGCRGSKLPGTRKLHLALHFAGSPRSRPVTAHVSRKHASSFCSKTAAMPSLCSGLAESSISASIVRACRLASFGKGSPSIAYRIHCSRQAGVKWRVPREGGTQRQPRRRGWQPSAVLPLLCCAGFSHTKRETCRRQ